MWVDKINVLPLIFLKNPSGKNKILKMKRVENIKD